MGLYHCAMVGNESCYFGAKLRKITVETSNVLQVALYCSMNMQVVSDANKYNSTFLVTHLLVFVQCKCLTIFLSVPDLDIKSIGLVKLTLTLAESDL